MKYKITSKAKVLTNGVIVHQIKATETFFLRDGGKIEKGTYGGWVENKNNLSQSGSSWIFTDAAVYGNATVKDDAIISIFGSISDNATVGGSAEVSGAVSDFAVIGGKAMIRGRVCDQAIITGNTIVDTLSTVRENTVLDGNVLLEDSTLSVASDENLLRNYFNTNPITCEISHADIHTTKEVTTSPVNFPTNKEAVFFTITPKAFSLKRLNANSIVADSPAKLLEKVWLSVKENFENFQKAYYNLSFFIEALKDFMLKNKAFYFYENLDIWVNNFISKIEATTRYDEASYNVIKQNKAQISLLAKQYLFSQFLGIFMWVGEPNHEKSWINFMKTLTNYCNVDLHSKTICSLDPEVFVWNKELVFMVQEICNFSNKWGEKQCQLFESLNSSFKLYFRLY